MGGEPECVAMAERVNLRLVPGAADERVVRRHGAIVIQAQHFSRVAVRILRAAAVTAARRRHIELAVAAPGEPRRPADARAATEDVREIGDRRPVEAATSHRQRRLPLGAGRLQVGEVDEVVGRKLRMEQNVHQPRSSLDAHRRDAGDGFRIQHAVADDAESAFLLRDEQGSVRQEREAPRIHQAARHRYDADPHHFGGVVLDRARRESVAARIQPARLARRSRTAPSAGRCRAARAPGIAQATPSPMIDARQPCREICISDRLIQIVCSGLRPAAACRRAIAAPTCSSAAIPATRCRVSPRSGIGPCSENPGTRPGGGGGGGG